MSIPIQLARDYLAAGLCVLPAQPVEKRPALAAWRTYQSRLPTEKEVEAWFSNGHEALCIVAGAVSGSLECIDFDAGGECFEPWAESIPDDLFGRLVVERTPSGGVHVSYRCEAAKPNRKLAEGMRDKKRATLIETRGEGGLFLCAPSPGYRLVQGGYDAVPTISEAERRVLLDAAIALSELPDASPPASPAHPSPAPSATFDERPGDAFNRDEAAFYALLERHGWRFLGRNGENLAFQRPGKTGNGLSATFNGVNFHVFSSNAEPFPVGFNGSPFTVYALLEHGGDATAAAKDLLGRGYGRAADPCAGVDLSGILSKMKEPDSEEPAEPEPENPGQLPERLLDVPGFVNDLKDHTLRTAKYPNRPLALAGALAMLSMLTGRKFRNASDNRTNLYLLALAPSSAGKDAPRRVNMSLAVQTGYGEHMGDAFASGEGLEDALTLTPCMLFQTDEIAFLFNSLKGTEARFNTMNAVLLKAFTSANGVYARRRKAVQTGRNAGAPLPTSIRNPHLVLYGTATPEKFYQSLNKDELVNGLVGRCLILEGERRRMNDSLAVGAEFPDSVLNTVAALREIGRENILTGDPQVLTIPETPEARALARELELEANKYYDDAYERHLDAEMAIWGRAFEKAEKLAMLYALSQSVTAPRLTPEAYRWGWDVAKFSTKRLLFMADCYVYDSEFDKEVRKVVRLLRDHNGRMSHSRLIRACRLDKDTFRKVMDTLVEGERVVRLSEKTGQRASTYYQLKGTR